MLVPPEVRKAWRRRRDVQSIVCFLSGDALSHNLTPYSYVFARLSLFVRISLLLYALLPRRLNRSLSFSCAVCIQSKRTARQGYSSRYQPNQLCWRNEPHNNPTLNYLRTAAALTSSHSSSHSQIELTLNWLTSRSPLPYRKRLPKIATPVLS